MAAKTPAGKTPKVDYKKEQKELYQPGRKPALVQVPEMGFIMVEGVGAPEGPAYQNAISALYALSFTIKMSKMGIHRLEGYFEYSMMPLEGLWWAAGAANEAEGKAPFPPAARSGSAAPDGLASPAAGSTSLREVSAVSMALPGGDRNSWHWVSMVRQPAFVGPEIFAWALDAAKAKKPEVDFSAARFEHWEEGLCVQMMHVGPYSTEPASIAQMEAFIAENGLLPDFSDTRRHHELYLGDPRKSAPEKRKTILRTPVRRLP